ncbi:MAG: hypothetical protein KGJ77_02770 [Acidobacteriota bacterium]|nr:hypothetical protein [Acidobacteriota bacterium]
MTCPPTTTVPGLPDRAGAERYARDFLSRAGLDVTGATVGATGGSDGWTVTFSPALDGLPVLGGATSVTLGAHGVVAAASGKLAPPVDSGSYPLVGVAAAIDRLRQGWAWIVYSGPVPLAAGGGAVPVEPPSTSPQPTTPATTAAPRIVRITGVHLALAWAWPVAPRSDTAWLVPVYVFALGPGSPYPFLGGGVPVLGVADAYVTGR